MELEEALSKQLEQICEKDGKEKFPKQSAKIFHKLGLIYKTEGLKQGDKIKLIQSAALLNAAIVRKPENVEEITQDLYNFCFALLKIAEAANQKADLIEYSKIIGYDIAEMRRKVNSILATISLIAEDISDEDFTTLKRKKVETMRSLQNTISEDYKKIMQHVAGFCKETLGNPPCKYALVGLGSLARKEITPYSDFENVIVLDDEITSFSPNIQENIKKYFRWFTVTFQIILINLGETNISRVQIPSLNNGDKTKFNFYDAVTPLGIAFDGMMPHACKFPLGRQVKTKKKPFTLELIHTVSKMASFVGSREDIKNGYHLAAMLMTSCFVAENQQIYEQFQELVKREVLLLDKSLHHLSIENEIKENEKVFHISIQLNKLRFGNDVNIKKMFYRSSTVFISAVGKIHSIKESGCFDIVESLMQAKKLTKLVGHHLKFAIAVACETRLRVCMNRKSQDDMFQALEIQNKFMNDTVGIKSCIEYFTIIKNFQGNIFNLDNISTSPISLVPNICFVLGHYTFAIKWWFRQKFEMGNSKKEKISYVAGVARGLLRIALCKYKLGHYQGALSNLQYSLKIYKEFNLNCTDGNSFYYWYDKDHSIPIIYYWIGKSNYKLGQYNEALGCYRKFSVIYQHLYKKISDNSKMGHTYFMMGMCECHLSQHKEALVDFKTSLKFRQKKKKDNDLFLYHYLIGCCNRNLGKYKEALTSLQLALQIIHQVSDRVFNDNLEVDLFQYKANIYHQIGRCRLQSRQYEEALIDFQTSLNIHQQYNIDVINNNELSDCHYFLGLCNFFLDQYHDALPEIQTSLHTFQPVVDDPTKSLGIVAYRHYLIGFCKYQLSQYKEAVTDFQFSLEIHQQVSMKHTKNTIVASRPKWIEDCKNKIALSVFLTSKGIQQQTVDDLNDDQQIVNDQTMSSDTADCHYQNGLHKCYLNQFEAALFEFRTALEIHQHIVDEPTKSSNVAHCQFWIGFCKYNFGQYEVALKKFQTSLEILQQTGDCDDMISCCLDLIENCDAMLYIFKFVVKK